MLAEPWRRKTYFMVMENFFHTPVEIHRRYDLKGSTQGRSLPPDLLRWAYCFLPQLPVVVVTETAKSARILNPSRAQGSLGLCGFAVIYCAPSDPTVARKDNDMTRDGEMARRRFVVTNKITC